MIKEVYCNCIILRHNQNIQVLCVRNNISKTLKGLKIICMCLQAEPIGVVMQSLVLYSTLVEIKN